MILTKFSIQKYILELKMQDLRSMFIILVNITLPYLGPIIWIEKHTQSFLNIPVYHYIGLLTLGQ